MLGKQITKKKYLSDWENVRGSRVVLRNDSIGLD